MPWVNETACHCRPSVTPVSTAVTRALCVQVCNCSGHAAGAGSPHPTPANPSSAHVGRAPVYMPYVGVANKPTAHYNVSIPAGHNFHFPKGGMCAPGAALGADGCTWRVRPEARMFYGADLIAAGWDRAFVPDTPTNVSHTRANQAAFARALRNLDALLAPAACGD